MPSLLMDRVSKYFETTGVLANDEAGLIVRDREIHALVGENGAGKTTLMRVLCGLERADSGRVELEGREVRIEGPAAAARLGIAMVHQHFTTVPEFSVAENAVLGDEPRRAGLFLDRGRAAREAGALIASCGFSLDPAAPASSLTVGERQQLEIVKALRRDPGLLVLDEPTSMLAEREAASLFATLRALRDAGKTIVIITHKVREVLAIADSVTVMRAGRSVARVDAASTSESELARLVMGGESGRGEARRGEARAPRVRGGGPVFELREVGLAPRGRRRHSLEGISLRVESGEILGLCGVAGNGLSELEDLASGLVRPDSGEVLLRGEPLPRRRRPGLGYVPADRMRRGTCLDASLAENLVALDRGAFFPRGLVDRAGAERFAREAIERFSIKGSPADLVGELSGGNVQKAVLARELSGDPGFLLVSSPTWGLDLAGAEFVYGRLERACESGAAILLISYNLDEVLALSDRVAVLYGGRLACDLPNDGRATRESLGEYMLGLRAECPEGRGG